MKSPKQKARIREMLRADAGEKNASWAAFKQQVAREFEAEKAPPLEIAGGSRRTGRPRFAFAWLAPAFAVFLFGIGFILLRHIHIAHEKPVVARVDNPAKATPRTMRRGDVYKAEKREIRFLRGNATLTENNDAITVAATNLKADFRLRQKVNMRIEHPLVAVTITGTEFTIDTVAKGGKINLTEGRLRIDLKSEGGEPVLLVAPIRFEFSGKSHSLKKAEPKTDKLLYRYELQNGEVFFGHPVRSDESSHTIEVLGGKVETIAASDLLRFAPVEKP